MLSEAPPASIVTAILALVWCWRCLLARSMLQVRGSALPICREPDLKDLAQPPQALQGGLAVTCARLSPICGRAGLACRSAGCQTSTW